MFRKGLIRLVLNLTLLCRSLGVEAPLLWLALR
jgi:hypothetical protein